MSGLMYSWIDVGFTTTWKTWLADIAASRLRRKERRPSSVNTSREQARRLRQRNG